MSYVLDTIIWLHLNKLKAGKVTGYVNVTIQNAQDWF